MSKILDNLMASRVRQITELIDMFAVRLEETAKDIDMFKDYVEKKFSNGEEYVLK